MGAGAGVGAGAGARDGASVGPDSLAVSQTLSVLSLEPETMVLPSGEKATERTEELCASCFSALRSRDAVASTGVVSYGLEG